MADALRRIWPYAAGIGIAFLVIFVLEAVLNVVVHVMPTATLAGLLVIYVVASFAGGLIAALVSDGRSLLPSIATGCALTIAGIVDIFAAYHPTWFRVASLLIYLPLSYLGCLAARGRRAKP